MGILHKILIVVTLDSILMIIIIDIIIRLVHVTKSCVCDHEKAIFNLY